MASMPGADWELVRIFRMNAFVAIVFASLLLREMSVGVLIIYILPCPQPSHTSLYLCRPPYLREERHCTRGGTYSTAIVACGPSNTRQPGSSEPCCDCSQPVVALR